MNAIASSLSYGEKALLGIAIAIASNPSLLLLDEPVAGLSTVEADKVCSIIQALRERKMTICVIEHSMRTIMGISDRIVVLNQGRKIADAPPGEIREDVGVVKAYLGEKGDA
jgi:branched-chain amino acid transport system ATP-binding protein